MNLPSAVAKDLLFSLSAVTATLQEEAFFQVDLPLSWELEAVCAPLEAAGGRASLLPLLLDFFFVVGMIHVVAKRLKFPPNWRALI